MVGVSLLVWLQMFFYEAACGSGESLAHLLLLVLGLLGLKVTLIRILIRILRLTRLVLGQAGLVLEFHSPSDVRSCPCTSGSLYSRESARGLCQGDPGPSRGMRC